MAIDWNKIGSEVAKAVETGVTIVSELGAVATPQASGALNAALALVKAGAALYAEVRADLAPTDQAAVEAQIERAKALANADVDRVLAEIATDAAK